MGGRRESRQGEGKVHCEWGGVGRGREGECGRWGTDSVNIVCCGCVGGGGEDVSGKGWGNQLCCVGKVGEYFLCCGCVG